MTTVTHTESTVIPYHKWTDGGTMVRLLKCVSKDRTAHGGFVWPKSGPVSPLNWVADTQCGNGLHGWAWGFAFGNGMTPDIDSHWIVFEADPNDVVLLDGGKVKCRQGVVIYCGDSEHDARKLIARGQFNWIFQSATSGAQATSATSGDQATSATSGDQATSATSGYQATSATSGYQATSATSGDQATSATSGTRATSATSGYQATSATSGDQATSATSGTRATSATSGYQATSATSGYQATSATSGDQATSATSGYQATSKATGKFSVAAASGSQSTLECSDTGLAATTADVCFWKVRKGAVLVQRTIKGVWLFEADKLDFADGDLLRIEHGIIAKV